MRYFDSHAHVNLSPLRERAEELLDQCAREGILVNVIGVDYETSVAALDLARNRKGVYCSVGFHPNNVGTENDWRSDLAKIELLFADKDAAKIVCVGEVGLDASREGHDLAEQERCFLAFADLAKRVNRPLNIHCRDAHGRMAELLTNCPVPPIIHCFTSTEEAALRYARLGCFVSIPGVVTFKNAKSLHAAVRALPLEQIVVETDSPYLSPEPFRGQVNDPLKLPLVVEAIARLRGAGVEETAATIFETTVKALRIDAKL